MYLGSGDAGKRLANQEFYIRMTITEVEQVCPNLAEPFATITTTLNPERTAEEPAAHSNVASSHKGLWVRGIGLQPTTACLEVLLRFRRQQPLLHFAHHGVSRIEDVSDVVADALPKQCGCRDGI
jgi:hypothetical protein